MQIRTNPRRLVAILGVCTALVTATPGIAMASVIRNPPWADMNCSHYGGAEFPETLDTRQSCVNAQAVLSGAGYQAYANTWGPSAATVMSTNYAQSDAIWTLFGHANAGFITTYSDATGRTDLAVQPGVSGNCTGNNACLNNYTSAQLQRIKLMIFGGCYTANSAGNRGNDYILPRYVVFNKGVDAAVGWSHEISWPAMDRWSQAFFQSTGTFFNSAVYAENQVKALYGSFNGTDTSVWYGNWNLYVRPASYGN